MKTTLVLLFLIVLPITQEKTIRFDQFLVKTGINNHGSFIQLRCNKKIIFEKSGGEGTYKKIDSLDYNNDGYLDFVYSYLFEDYFHLGLIMSKDKLHYEYKSLGDFSFPDIYCDNFVQSDTSYLSNFHIVSGLKSGKMILINCILKDGRFKKTCLTDTLFVNSNSRKIKTY